jgi:hypothetical protein
MKVEDRQGRGTREVQQLKPLAQIEHKVSQRFTLELGGDEEEAG